MGGKRIELEGEARKEYYRQYHRAYARKHKAIQVRQEPIGRTGEEEALTWRCIRGTDNTQKAYKDYYYRMPAYQTKAIWEPATDFGVLRFNIVLRGYQKMDVVGVLKKHFRFGRYIAVGEELKGTDRTLWDCYFRLPKRPTDQEVDELYKDFCLPL